MAKTDYRQYNNLITASEVTSKAMTNLNMDTSIIDDNIILIAELTHLKPHLGDYFWGELRKKHHNNIFSCYCVSGQKYFFSFRKLVST